MAQSDNWMFIIQCGQDEEEAEETYRDFESHMRAAVEGGIVRWVVAQLEMAPTTGSIHIQGVVYWPGRRALTTTINQFAKIWDGPVASFRLGRATPEEQKEYCTKEESQLIEPMELGDQPEPKRPGKRNDLWELKDAIDEGKTKSQCYDEFFPTMVRHPSCYDKYRAAKGMGQRNSEEEAEVIVFWGATDTGKTRLAIEMGKEYHKQTGKRCFLRNGQEKNFMSG